ncbi:MAG: hypothetical protein ACI30P_01675 [Muribaculaceae bacterium]
MKYKNTVVLMWNPKISSVKESDYEEWFDGLCTFREKFFNWSVWDYKHVGYGDRFILMRVRDEKTGIVMEYKLPEGWNKVGVINDRNPGSG